MTDTSTEEIKLEDNYKETGQVKIPKMKVVREMMNNTESTMIYIVKYKSKNQMNSRENTGSL